MLRLAVFTNHFPSRISTFFARDMAALLAAGFDIDIFPFYPLDPALWCYVPDILDERVLPRNRVHHLTLSHSLLRRGWSNIKLRAFLEDAVPIGLSAASFGLERFAKTSYVLLKALTWARLNTCKYDHVLAYWGNYAATCAYVFHRVLGRPIPFSMFLHAGMDLYEGQVFMREKLLYADNIIVVCDFNREFLSQQYSDTFPQISQKIYRYHLGLDLRHYDFNSDGRSQRTILAVGALEQYKGFDYLLRAGRLLSSQGLDFEIALVGDGKERQPLKRLAAELQIEQRTKFLGWFSPDQVRTAMRQATILVHPSNGLGDAVPTVIKEAMAVGLPVVASNVAGIPELLDNGTCGKLVPPRNPAALADAIGTLLANEELRRRYSQRGRKYAEETFDLWRNGRRLADILSLTRRLEPSYSSYPLCS